MTPPSVAQTSLNDKPVEDAETAVLARVCFTCGQSKPLTLEFFALTPSKNRRFRRDCRVCHARITSACEKVRREQHKRAKLASPRLIPTERVCSVCGENKPLTGEFFYRQTTAKFGFKACCKSCHLQKKAQHYQQHRESILVKDRAYYERNRARIQERCRQHYWQKAARQRGEALQDYLLRREERLRKGSQVWAAFSLDSALGDNGSFHDIVADTSACNPLQEVLLRETVDTLLFWVDDTLQLEEQDVLFAYADSLFDPEAVADTLHQPLPQVQSVIASIQQRALATFGNDYASFRQAA